MVPENKEVLYKQMMGTGQKDVGANWNKLSIAKYATIWATK